MPSQLPPLSQDDTITPVVSIPKPSTTYINDQSASSSPMTSPMASARNSINEASAPRQSSFTSARTCTSSEERERKGFSLRAALRKPFQGWSREALWAKRRGALDDVYNFPSVRRRGSEE